MIEKHTIMALEPYGIGGTEVKTDASEAFVDIPQNRVLLAEKLTVNPTVKPEIVEGLTDIASVFQHFAPEVDVTFETEQGVPKREALKFKGLEDFGAKGITQQSEYLNELNAKKEQYQKIIKQLKSNKLLRKALDDKESKESIIHALQALINELNQVD